MYNSCTQAYIPSGLLFYLLIQLRLSTLFADSAAVCEVCCGGALQVNWCGYGCLLMCSFAVLLVAVICG